MILTKNEQQDLPGCLESVSWCDDIHLFDSYSDDKTIEIARNFGARVTQRIYDNESMHQNWAMENLDFKYPWVFYIDADERMTPSLIESVSRAVVSEQECVSFRIERRDFMNDRWLKHVQACRYYQRLFMHKHMRWERLINAVNVPDGPVGQLTGYLDHFFFSKGMAHWINRHNRYSTMEAQQIVDNRANKKPFSLKKALTATDFHERRSHQKEFYYRLPGRPLIKFLYLYFLKGGFLDGKEGFLYSWMIFAYEHVILIKTLELDAKVAGRTSLDNPTAPKKDEVGQSRS
jgi:glycosyltransferase involved in cell wall biosynthesis